MPKAPIIIAAHASGRTSTAESTPRRDVASKLGPQGTAIADAAKSSWLSGFHFSLVIGAIVVAVAGLVAWNFLPDVAADADFVADPASGSAAATDRTDIFDVGFALTPEDELALEAEALRPVVGD